MIFVDKIPHKSLGVQVKVLANKLTVGQHCDRKKHADVSFYIDYMIDTKSKLK